MNTKQLTSLLKSAKDDSTFGGVFSDREKESLWNGLSRDLHFSSTPDVQPVSSLGTISYTRWFFGHAFLRPLALTSFLLSCVFGSVAIANASYESLPGDVTYPVKLFLEDVQKFSFFGDEGSRAQLQIEFANRRLQEVKQISRTETTSKDVRVQQAVDGFKKEIKEVNSTLETLRQSQPEVAVALAKAIDEKTDDYTTTITQSEAALPEGNQVAVADMRSVVADANQQAVNVIVSQQETKPKTETAKDLQHIFQKDIKDIQDGYASTLGRLSVIESAIVSRPSLSSAEEVKTYMAQVYVLRDTTLSFNKRLRHAMDLSAAGGFRSAFDEMTSLKTDLSTVEDQLATLEIRLSTVFSSAPSDELKDEKKDNTSSVEGIETETPTTDTL